MRPRSGDFSRLEVDTSRLVSKTGVLVERDIRVESGKEEEGLGLDTFVVGGEGGRSSRGV